MARPPRDSPEYDAAAMDGITALRNGAIGGYMAASVIPPEEMPEIVREYSDLPQLTDEEISAIAATMKAFEDRPVLPTLKPSGVLDERNAVVEWYRDPVHASTLRSYIAGEKVEMTSSCLNYWIPGADEKYAASLIRNVISSEIFYVSDDMAHMADAASRSLPDQVTFNEAMLPAPNGVIRLEQPRYTTDRRGGRQGTVAIGWRILHAINGPHLMLTIFAHPQDTVDTVNAFLMRDNPEKMHLLAPWTISAFQFLPLGKPGQISGWHDKSDVPFLAALLLLFGQKILVSNQARVDRPTMRRSQRLKLPGSITVIDLRKIEQIGEETGESRPVEWGFRWFVRTHWRHLNKPDDPAAMWCEVHQRKCKLTPIFAYAKNAHRTDLPWKDPDRKLNRLVR